MHVLLVVLNDYLVNYIKEKIYKKVDVVYLFLGKMLQTHFLLSYNCL